MAIAKYNCPLVLEKPEKITGKLANDTTITKSGATLYDVILCKSSLNNEDISSSSSSCVKISVPSKTERGIAGETYEFEDVSKISDGFYKAKDSFLQKKPHSSKVRRRWLVSVEERVMKLNKFFSSDMDYNAHLLALRLFTARNTGEGAEIITLSKKTGLEYLFALSGMHMSFVLVLAKFVFERFLSKKKAKIISIILVCMYYFLASRSPSFTRSFLMVLLSMAVPNNYGVFISFVFQVLFFPYSVSNTGFDYSYLAVCGIILLYKPFYTLLTTFIHKRIAGYFSLSFSACSFSWVLSLISGGVFVPLGVLISPVAGILALLILFCGLLLALFPANIVISFLTNICYRVLVFMMEKLSILNFEFSWPAYIVFVLFFALLYAIFIRINKKKRKLYEGLLAL